MLLQNRKFTKSRKPCRPKPDYPTQRKEGGSARIRYEGRGQQEIKMALIFQQVKGLWKKIILADQWTLRITGDKITIKQNYAKLLKKLM